MHHFDESAFAALSGPKAKAAALAMFSAATLQPAPLALAGPAVLLCLPKPSPANAKPRYRLTAAGQFERIAA